MTYPDSDRIPTREELADDSLDGKWVARHFYGKSLAEAEEVFAAGCREGNPLTYTDDLYAMEPVGFRFYVRAAIRFALSERANEQPDVINGLAGGIASQLEHRSAELTSSAAMLAEFCGSVVEQFERFGADPEIYEGLREEYQRLAEAFAGLVDG